MKCRQLLPFLSIWQAVTGSFLELISQSSLSNTFHRWEISTFLPSISTSSLYIVLLLVNHLPAVQVRSPLQLLQEVAPPQADPELRRVPCPGSNQTNYILTGNAIYPDHIINHIIKWDSWLVVDTNAVIIIGYNHFFRPDGEKEKKRQKGFFPALIPQERLRIPVTMDPLVEESQQGWRREALYKEKGPSLPGCSGPPSPPPRLRGPWRSAAPAEGPQADTPSGPGAGASHRA